MIWASLRLTLFQNGYAEAVDGAVFVAGMVSLGFVETDPRVIVREATKLLHTESPYRQCLDEIIALADRGKSFEQIAQAVIDRWAAEYPGTNNAVANGGIIALCVWFGDGDFLKTVNLACRVSDYTDADCNAAGAAAVVGAMHGLKAIPKNLLEPLRDRIAGDKMGDLSLPPVDESIAALGLRTAAFGEKMLLAHGARVQSGTLIINREAVQTQPLERFTLADLTRYWQPDWKLERAGFGATIGGRGGYPGGTWLADGVLTTWPRKLMRGVVLTRKLALPNVSPRITVEVFGSSARARLQRNRGAQERDAHRGAGNGCGRAGRGRRNRSRRDGVGMRGDVCCQRSRSDGWESRKMWRRPRCFWLRTRPNGSPEFGSRWMAGATRRWLIFQT